MVISGHSCSLVPYGGRTIPRIHDSAIADFAHSGPLTETCLLGNIAKRVDGRIVWDAENLAITNLPEANRLVRTEYRQGWEL